MSLHQTPGKLRELITVLNMIKQVRAWLTLQWHTENKIHSSQDPTGFDHCWSLEFHLPFITLLWPQWISSWSLNTPSLLWPQGLRACISVASLHANLCPNATISERSFLISPSKIGKQLVTISLPYFISLQTTYYLTFCYNVFTYCVIPPL